jgi:TatD DNase family protein
MKEMASAVDEATWCDSHCHLTADRFNEDRREVIERAREAGVRKMIAIGSGYGFEANSEAVALAHRETDIHATVGVHPHEASELSDALMQQLGSWLGDPEVVALGECGLDYHYMNSDREAQRSALARQIALARERGVPVVLHVRGDDPNAYEEMLEIWQGEGRGELEGLLHCYTGDLDFARRALDLGFLISFSGIVTFKRSEALREVARATPLDRLLVETDAPFLAPQGRRGRRNEPAWVVAVGETLGNLHGLSSPEVARITTENARRFFRITD